jgi:hypothetical protein
LVSLVDLATDVVHHISFLETEDMLYKSISWPLFLAGAETEDAVQRLWIMNTLDQFYNSLYWGYIRTVKRILETIWIRNDAAPMGAAKCWVNYDVKELGAEMLIA